MNRREFFKSLFLAPFVLPAIAEVLAKPLPKPHFQLRKLRVRYTIEVARDLRAFHGLDVEDELSAILKREIIKERRHHEAFL